MKPEVCLDLILWRGGDEVVQRGADRLRAGLVHVRGGQRRRLALDPEPEVEHVEYVVVGPDGRGLHGERRRLRHRQHERASALEGFDKTLGAQPGHRLADDGAGYPVLVDELGLRGQLVAWWQVAGEDLVLQPGDHPLRQCRGHRVPNSALSLVSARIWSLSVTPRPGRSGTQIRPSRISIRSLKSGLSHSKCSTHGSMG